MSDDVNYINLERLRTFLQEVKRLIPTNYATKTELNNYFPKSGGQLSGTVISRDVDNDLIRIRAGTDDTSSNIVLTGKNRSANNGQFSLVATDGSSTCDLTGKPNGSLTWNNKNIDVIEEQGDGYIRYSNGLQICWGVVSAQTQIGSTTLSFPKSFASANVYITISVSNTNTMYVNVAGVTQSWVSFVNNNGNGVITWQAIGRWK